MPSTYENRLSSLSSPDTLATLTKMQRGIEKESLRVTTDGRLSQKRHPESLGSSLTHPLITTDYAESLLEFITPPLRTVDETLDYLRKIHCFVYQNIDDELLWVNSMPCIVDGNDSIPIAEYGSSNLGKLKRLYRVGLDHRYGRLMQTIAGIHYNLSFPHEFWQAYRSSSANTPMRETSGNTLQTFISDAYFNLIRNFQIYSPLLVYLFGASPAVCASFLNNRRHKLDELRPGTTFYKPFATSLRMSDLGYQNDAQSGLHICYNSLEAYVNSMNHAIRTPYPEYEKIGLKQNGQYQQLSTSILQIENEYYGSIRPKPIPKSGERPTITLARTGVEYIEMRCIDLNPFNPLGIDKQQILFLDCFALYCLLETSPLFSTADYSLLNQNFQAIVMEGRNPNTEIDTSFYTDTRKTTFRQWAGIQLDKIKQAAALLDSAHHITEYTRSVELQIRKIHHPEETPSALILESLKDSSSNFFDFALATAQDTAQQFKAQQLSPEDQSHFSKLAKQSLKTQKELENTSTIDFDQYLKDYLAL